MVPSLHFDSQLSLARSSLVVSETSLVMDVRKVNCFSLRVSSDLSSPFTVSTKSVYLASKYVCIYNIAVNVYRFNTYY